MASKKVTKKVVKKTAVVVKMPAFNKANAKLLAENIFSDKHGRVSFLKLCEGKLSNGKDGGRTLHCALGEAYFTFVDTRVAKFVNDTIKKFGERDEDNGHEVFQSKYLNRSDHSVDHIPTLAATDALVDVAQLRNKNPNSKKKLALALLDSMSENDEVCGASYEDDLRRAERVADIWNERVIPLLK